MKKSISKFKVRYYETDKMGVVHHSNYVRWLEMGRESYLDDILGKSYVDFEKEGYISPIKDVSIKYLKPCTYGDEITIYTWVCEVKPAKVTFEYEIYKNLDVLVSKAKTTLVFVSDKTFIPLNMKKEIPEIYTKYLENIIK